MDIERKRKPLRKRYLLLLLFLGIIGLCCAWLSDYYAADMEALEAFSVEFSGEIYQDGQDRLIFDPGDAEAGFIFYPGGKVDHEAYIPLLKSIASKDILCVLVPMPLHLALLDANAADGIQEQFSHIENWYMGGHSLGGAIAASYISDHAADYRGLVLLGAYSTADLSETDLQVLSIFGSEDLVMNREKYDACLENLPAAFNEIVIEGGCHSQFGMYGSQDGDGKPGISPEKQIQITADAIATLIMD